MPSALTPWKIRRALRCRSAFASGVSRRRGGDDAGGVVLGLLRRTTLAPRPAARALRRGRPLRRRRWPWPDGSRPCRPSTPRTCPAPPRPSRRPATTAPPVAHTHAGDVIEPVRRRAMTAALPQIGLRHPTGRQRHPGRGQMLQPGELRHQVQRVTSTRQTRVETIDQRRRRNRRQTRPPGPASRTPHAPENPYEQPYSGGTTALPGRPAAPGARPLATVPLGGSAEVGPWLAAGQRPR